MKTLPCHVTTLANGHPTTVAGEDVTLIEDDWIVKDRWWTDEPTERHYFDVVLETGRQVDLVFDRKEGTWHELRP